MLDIIFLSYDETNAELNWHKLRERFPRAQRIHGVTGIKEAHQQAARIAKSEFFFIVDGDNSIHEDFHFQVDFQVNRDTLYVWRCLNPVNDLLYGFGAVKLYNKFLLLELNRPTSFDVATTIAPKYKPVMITASTTIFNSSAFEAWRGAFRESCKLAINIISNPGDRFSQERLDTWCRVGANRPHGLSCIEGALQGRSYVQTQWGNSENLSLINDFDWLKRRYDTDQLINSSPASLASDGLLSSPV